MEIFKISKKFPISENFPKFWKSENFPQILQKSENLPKCNEKDQGSENRPNIWKPEIFPKNWNFSKNMSLGPLCGVVKTLIVSGDQRTKGQTMSPIELLWTAKKKQLFNNDHEWTWRKKTDHYQGSIKDHEYIFSLSMTVI